MALEKEVPIATEEFKTLNLCLDDAIAEAVTEFSRCRERTIADEETERLGFLAHKQRNLLNAAMMSFDMLKTGRFAVGGSTGRVLGRSLLREIADRLVSATSVDNKWNKWIRFLPSEDVASVRDHLRALSHDALVQRCKEDRVVGYDNEPLDELGILDYVVSHLVDLGSWLDAQARDDDALLMMTS